MIISFVFFVCSAFVYVSLFFGGKDISIAAGGLLGEAFGYAFVVIAPSAILGKLTKRTYIGLILSGIIIYIFERSNAFESGMEHGISLFEANQYAGGFTPIIRAMSVINDGSPAPLVIILIFSYAILRSKDLFSFLKSKQRVKENSIKKETS